MTKTDPKIWADAKQRKLHTVPADIVNKIEKWQPINRSAANVQLDPLALLHTLDIADKHRLPFSTEARIEALNGRHQVEFADEEAAARNQPPDMTIHGASLTDGAVLLSGRTKDRIVKIRGDQGITVRILIESEGVLELIKRLGTHVEQIVADIG